MARILFLAQRIPYPPNKGDKVRSYHLLRYLADRHEVFLATFVDDPDDVQHVATVGQWCVEVKARRLHPWRARVASLAGLLRNEPLTLAYYRDDVLEAWVRELREQRRVDKVFVFSSSMAQYAKDFDVPVLVDFVDVDSAKWTDYAPAHRWPMSWLYRREGRYLLAYERGVASRVMRSFFVTEKEVGLFTSLAPECVAHVQAIGNGVDTDYFTPRDSWPSPFGANEVPLVFTGAMDYWPNVDAVTWFAREVLPQLRERWPGLRLSVVGRNPTPAVQALAGEAVRVTGTVADVRPWLQHAAVVVAPLRLARGIQNKILEAMAMAKPVVAAVDCVDAIDGEPGVHLAAAELPSDYADRVSELLTDTRRAEAMGIAARRCVEQRYTWGARLGSLDEWLEAA